MRSRLWILILRELPFPLRWIGTEIVRFVQWIDSTTDRLLKSLRDAPAWYFVTTIGASAIFLTILMFVSVIDETSGQRSQGSSRRRLQNLSRQDLENNHDWSVQDRWRVAHLFVMDQPPSKPKDLQIDSRLMAATSNKASLAKRPVEFVHRSRGHSSQSDMDKNLEVRLELGRPKKAQQGNRLAGGTVLDPSPRFIDLRPQGRIRSQDPRLLVQATWEFGTDCSPYQPVVARPSRRPVLVPLPEPETDLPPVVVRHERPDLSFELDMIRHFSVAGRFPPGSHLVSQSNHRTHSESVKSFSSELVSHEESPWKQFHSHHERTATASISPYLGIGAPVPSHVARAALDEHESSLRAIADVAVSLNVIVPDSVTAGISHKSSLLISNDGQDPIARIEVRDSLADLKTVIDADPDATRETTVDPRTGIPRDELHREILNLIPGETQELSLRWIPQGHARQIHRMQVIAYAEVSTSTEVIQPDPIQQMPSIPPERFEHHPALACDFEHLDRVTVGQEVELQITVRNTGDVMLHGVKVQIDIPDQFSHRDGRTIQFDAGNLPVNGRNRTVIRLSAREQGEAVNQVRLIAEESVHAKGKLVIHVDERRKVNDRAQQVRRPQSVLKSVDRLPLSKPLPTGVCCCQQVTEPQPISSNLLP